MTSPRTPMLGARPEAKGTRFGLFTTRASRCQVRLFDPADPRGQPIAEHPLGPLGDGYFEALLPGVTEGALYKFVLDEQEWPDPYARFLPHGVHGPALVTRLHHDFRAPAPAPRPLSAQVVYELHIGTFTPEGTYRAAQEKLESLRDLGITTIELMPLAAFDGTRGWGYDGVAHFAPFAPYGTPDELCAFIDHAHSLGLLVLLDVVYNHFGPSGNYLSCYSETYFTREHQTAWGDAPDFSSPIMRRHVLDNARYWISQFRFDGLRLDATHAIIDPSPKHILRELADLAPALGPGKVLIAEDGRNDPALITDLGMNAVWADDFHHQVRVTLTGERDGYYGAYEPGAAGLAQAINEGWIYAGQRYAPLAEDRGKPATALRAEHLVYCIQNHDQVGNRALGERLSAGVPRDAYAAVSMLLLFLPMTPLLFMGQEWACTSPFLYFTDHEPDLGQKIKEGRRDEFRDFEAFSDPAAREGIPDPQAVETFERSKLRWEELEVFEHRMMLSLYKNMLLLRRSDPILQHGAREHLRATAAGPVLRVERKIEGESRILLVNLSADAASCAGLLPGDARVELMLANRPGAWISNKLGPYEAWLIATAPRDA